MAAKTLFLASLSLAHGSLLRRTHFANTLEFGRVVSSDIQSAQEIFSHMRMLEMSMPEETMSLDMTMSLADDAMSMDFAMSLADDAMSMDFAMSMPSDVDETVTTCDQPHTIVPVDLTFEVSTSVGEDAAEKLTAIITSALEQDYVICPAADDRKLLEGERKLEEEESAILGIGAIGAEIVEGECESEDAECDVVKAEIEVLVKDYEEDMSDEAKAELIEKLLALLEEIDSVSPRETSTVPETTTDAGNETQGEEDDVLPSNVKTAMFAVVAVAGVSVAAVLIQKKLSKRRQAADDKSLDGSTVTAPNTTYDTAPLNSDGHTV